MAYVVAAFAVFVGWIVWESGGGFFTGVLVAFIAMVVGGIAAGIFSVVSNQKKKQEFIARAEGGFEHRKRILRKWKAFLDRSDVLILDTETTGISDRSEIVEISIIDTTGAVRFDALAMPQGRIPSAASDIHGLTRKKLKEEGAKAWPELHREVMDIIRSADTVLAYNAEFDLRLLTQTAERYELRVPRDPSWYDVLEDYRMLRPTGSHKLVSAVRREKVKIEGQAHRALYDCQCVLAVMRAFNNIDEESLKHVTEASPTRRQLSYIYRLRDEREVSGWMRSYAPKTKAAASLFIDELLQLPYYMDD
ncbi:MAG: 3'-5' exonuclease [Gammaproteobacteria bacterium]|nr:3'-5' exonuclease [Gammaproteobacteria bacterium]